MADPDEGKTRSNGIATGGGSEEGVCGTIEVELDPVVAGRGSDTLCSVLRDFFTGVASPPPPALFPRIKSSVAKSFPRLQDASRNSARDLRHWTRRGSPLHLGLQIFLGFLFTATLNAIIVSLLVSLAAACGFLAFFLTCLITIYIGALSMAAFVISMTTISAIIIVTVATGWIGFFWIVWLVTKKSLHLTSQSISKTSSTVSTYATAWQTRWDATPRSAG